MVFLEWDLVFGAARLDADSVNFTKKNSGLHLLNGNSSYFTL